jgi:hypothetical protein
MCFNVFLYVKTHVSYIFYIKKHSVLLPGKNNFHFKQGSSDASARDKQYMEKETLKKKCRITGHLSRPFDYFSDSFMFCLRDCYKLKILPFLLEWKFSEVAILEVLCLWNKIPYWTYKFGKIGDQNASKN